MLAFAILLCIKLGQGFGMHSCCYVNTGLVFVARFIWCFVSAQYAYICILVVLCSLLFITFPFLLLSFLGDGASLSLTHVLIPLFILAGNAVLCALSFHSACVFASFGCLPGTCVLRPSHFVGFILVNYILRNAAFLVYNCG